MKLCPYCSQDQVWSVRLPSAGPFAMCFECDSVWLPEEQISDNTGANFESYMQSLGKPADWSDIEKLFPVD